MVSHANASTWLLLLVLTACNKPSFKAQQADPVPTPRPEPLVASAPAEPAPVVDDFVSFTEKHKISLKVDLVFAIDTSASMDEELVATQNNLQKMLTVLNDGKLDTRIHFLVEVPLQMPAGTDPSKVAMVRQRVDSSDAISLLNDLFAGLYASSYFSINNQALPAPMPFRKDAKLEVVVITDDNGSGMGNLAADFDSGKTLNATFNGIVGLPTSVSNDACQVSNVGQEYITLAMQSGGSSLDICSSDWSALITRLSTNIVKRSVTFMLSKKPSDPQKMQLLLDKQKLVATDWVYDDKTNSVTLNNIQAVKDGSELSFIYHHAG